MRHGTRPAQDATVKSMTEEEFATFMRRRGIRVTRKNGRFWRADQGRYQPTHFYARLSSWEMSRPAQRCWAYRAALADGEEDLANGFIPMHLVRDVQDYALEKLHRGKRRDIRTSLKRLTFVEIVEPRLLLEEGLQVLRSAVERHGHGPRLSERNYRKSLEPFFNPRRGLILGALQGEELVGYVTAFVVERIGYVDEIHLTGNALNIGVGPGLTYQVVETCKRSGTVETLVHGLVVSERPGLTRFKEQLGFPVVEVPAVYWIAPGAKQLLRSFRPHAYYRFTGHRTDSSRHSA
jgi:hypothetical protein